MRERRCAHGGRRRMLRPVAGQGDRRIRRGHPDDYRRSAPQRRPSWRGPERVPYEPDGLRQVATHELILEPEHPVPGTAKRFVPPRVGRSAPRVVAAVHLDDEARRRREEVDDIAADRHLPPEGNAEALAAQLLPEPVLGPGGRGAHLGCAGDVDGWDFGAHEGPPAPGSRPGLALPGAGSVTGPHARSSLLRSQFVSRRPARPGAERAPPSRGPAASRASVGCARRRRRWASGERSRRGGVFADGRLRQFAVAIAVQRSSPPSARRAWRSVAPERLRGEVRRGAPEHGFGGDRAAAGGKETIGRFKRFTAPAEDARVGATLDVATSELVERGTYQAYGGVDSDYRPERWKHFREDYRFTGKEEDVEVGLVYFGKRFLNPLLGRWCNPDPLAIHSPGEADANLYAYVRGYVLKAIDPLGLQDNQQCYASEVDIKASEQRVQAAQMQQQAQAAQAMQEAPKIGPQRPVGKEPIPLREQAERAAMTGILSPATVTTYAVTGDTKQFMRLQQFNQNVTEAAMGPAAARQNRVTPDKEWVAKIDAAARAETSGALRGPPSGKEVVQRAMVQAELQATRATGILRGGRTGEHFVSDAVNSDATRAQQRLALRDRPEVRVTLELTWGRLSEPRRVDSLEIDRGKMSPGILPGGGTQRTAEGRVPVKVLKVDGM
jgi:RHS repeat-associated protein